MARILIIEDEKEIADLGKDYLEMNSFEVVICDRGDTGLEAALSEDFNLIVLDLMLPGIDGFEICRRVRAEKNIPIVILSARKDDIDKVRGLGLGADDYITKPFSPGELVARVKAHLASYERLVGSASKEAVNDIIEIKDIKIDKTARRVFVTVKRRYSPPRNFHFLLFLLKIPTKYSPRMICSGTYGEWNPWGILPR